MPEVKKGGRRLNSTTEQIRQAASVLGSFARKQLIETGFTEEQVKTAIDTLLRQNRLKRTGFGSYEFIPERRTPVSAPIEDRIWHAMRINPSWSCSDIALQAGSTVSYIYKRLREYRAEGFVKRAGARQVHMGAERLWRLTAAGREHLTRPAVQTFEPDPLVLLATKINKLVATGQARRFVDSRRAAKAACEELLAGLEKLG